MEYRNLAILLMPFFLDSIDSRNAEVEKAIVRLRELAVHPRVGMSSVDARHHAHALGHEAVLDHRPIRGFPHPTEGIDVHEAVRHHIDADHELRRGETLAQLLTKGGDLHPEGFRLEEMKELDHHRNPGVRNHPSATEDHAMYLRDDLVTPRQVARFPDRLGEMLPQPTALTSFGNLPLQEPCKIPRYHKFHPALPVEKTRQIA